jgi:hypothetical protein
MKPEQPQYPAPHHVTKKGYVRFRVPPAMGTHDAGKCRLGHDWIWEQHNGTIPNGMQVHHKNEDKQDNRIENLELADPVTHKRLHSGCELREGVWWKPCSRCGEKKPVTSDNWYGTQKREWPMSICKPCQIAAVVISKRTRRAAKKALGIPWQQRE